MKAMAAAFGIAALASGSAMASDGTITFNGEITATTCEVSGGGNGSGAGDITVTLPTVSASALPDGKTAGDSNFSLTLSGADCTDGKTAALWIEATQTPALDMATGALINQQAGGAKNVQVRLVNPSNNNPIRLDINEPVMNGDTDVANSNQPAATIAGKTATLNYVAQYLAVGGDAEAGKVSTYLTYSMQYN